ncbi:flagellar motor protein MotB [Spirochaeta lutea]|uniref:Flagellar motor protein MotB n=1 Tax=Spirochaeta lutea TaxID=1480694 RepID=A0A098R449_9SPIO|nr:flagellar motor protein MotB [Spirochaeta lutea]KGE73532.1 flagellar motor protein MotB [Spirochaeta lutea]
MAERKKKQKCPEGVPEYMLTYGDMVTLLLTFFVMMFTTATVDGYKLQLILAAFQGLGNFDGGNTLAEGRLAELGNNIESLPSLQAGRSLAQARRLAVSLFEPEVKANKVRITEDERGLVISLASDAFFDTASAQVKIEQTRDVLIKLAQLLNSPGVGNRLFRIEGHTDDEPTDPNGPWPTNWHLGMARALNTMLYLTEFGAPEPRFQVMTFGEFRPLVSNQTPEGMAYNRRVDVIILTEGNL